MTSERDENARLWRAAMQGVTSFVRRHAHDMPVMRKKEAPFDMRVMREETEYMRHIADVAPLPEVPAAPFNCLGRKQRNALKRGKTAPDAVIDLHGMHRAAAKAAFERFIASRRAEGARVALVITGKSDRNGGEGALKAELPLWMACPNITRHASGFCPASAKHGGDGAFYVFLRRA